MPTHPVDTSVAVYRALLHLYPADHRAEYGSHMVQLFRDCCRDAYRQRHAAGLADLWLSTLLDLLRTAFEERTRKGIRMNREAFARLGGLAGMLGAVVWGWLIFEMNERPAGGPSSYRYLDDLGPPAFAALLLFALGMAGHAAAHYTRPTRWITLAAALACFTGLTLFSLFMLRALPSWTLAMLGVLLMVLSYAVVGFTSLQANPLTRWAGAFLILAAGLMFLFNTEDTRVHNGLPLAFAWFLVGLARLMASRREASLYAAP